MLVNCCTISRLVKTSDGRGGYSRVMTVIGSHPCRLSGLTAKDVAFAAKMQDAVDAVIYIGAGVDVRVEDRITCRGHEYVALPPVPPSIPAYLKVMVKRVKR